MLYQLISLLYNFWAGFITVFFIFAVIGICNPKKAPFILIKGRIPTRWQFTGLLLLVFLAIIVIGDIFILVLESIGLPAIGQGAQSGLANSFVFLAAVIATVMFFVKHIKKNLIAPSRLD